MSNVLNITLNQGEDFNRVLTIKDSANVAVNITGYTFRGQVREKFNSPSTIAVFSFVVLDQGTNVGQVTWKLGNTALTSLVLTASKEYLYDVEMVTPAGDVTRILQGKATVSPEVTK
jgi:hypothetical protein